MRNLLIPLMMFLIPQDMTAGNIAADAKARYESCMIAAQEDDPAVSRCGGKYLDSMKVKLDRIFSTVMKSGLEDIKHAANNATYYDDQALTGYLKESEILDTEHKIWKAYEKVTCNNFRALGGEIYGAAGFIAFTKCRARIIEQRIEILLHELCAGTLPDDAPDDCKAIFKE